MIITSWYKAVRNDRIGAIKNPIEDKGAESGAGIVTRNQYDRFAIFEKISQQDPFSGLIDQRGIERHRVPDALIDSYSGRSTIGLRVQDSDRSAQ